MGPLDPLRRRRAEERHGQRHLLAKDRERLLDPGLTTRGESPIDRPAHEDRTGAEGQRDRHIEPGPNAAVDPDLGPAADRHGDALEHVDRRRHAVELAGAVVADPDPVDPATDRLERVGRRQDPLDDEWQVGPASDLGDDVPAGRPARAGRDRLGILARIGTRLRCGAVVGRLGQVAERDVELPLVSQVAGAIAEDRQIDGKDDRPVARADGSLDEVAATTGRRLRVELEEADAVGSRCRYVLDRSRGDRRPPSPRAR